MSALKILELDGIVIRKIPAESTSRWSYREGDENRLRGGETIVTDERGRKVIERVKQNALAGYVITMDWSQDTTVKFSERYSGFGPTVEEAYTDFLTKNK